MPGIKKKKKITNARSNPEQFNQNILGASPVYQYVLKTSLVVITNHVDWDTLFKIIHVTTS